MNQRYFRRYDQYLDDLAQSLNTRLWFESSDLLTLFSGDELCIINLNPAAEKIFGFNATEIIRKPLGSLVHPEDCDRVLQQMKLGKSSILRFRIVTKLGNEIELESIVSDYVDDNKSLVMLSRIVNEAMTISFLPPAMALQQILDTTCFSQCSLDYAVRDHPSHHLSNIIEPLSFYTSRTALPLPKDRFKNIHISPSRHDSLIQHAIKSIPHLVYKVSTQEHKHEKGICIAANKGYRKKENSKGWYSFQSFAMIKANLHDVMKVLMANSTCSFRSLMQDLHGKNFLDGAVIHQHHIPSNENTGEDEANLLVKWASFYSGTPLIQNQDLCYLEYSTVSTKDIPGIPKFSGKPSICGVYVMESMEVLECNSIGKALKLNRCIMKNSGFLIYPSNQDNHLHVSYSINLKACGVLCKTTSKIIKSISHKMALSLSNLQHIIDVRRMNSTQFITVDQWISDKSRSSCFLCMKSFTPLRRRHHCRVCGEVICGKCSLLKNASLPAIGSCRLRLCKSCENPPKQESRKSMESINIQRTTRSSMNDILSMENRRSMDDRILSGGLEEEERENSKTQQPQQGIFDMLCDLASQVMDCNLAVFGYIDQSYKWQQVCIGLDNVIKMHEEDICKHMLKTREPLIIKDASKDIRFHSSRLVNGQPSIRFFAGAPLIGSQNQCLGFICACDNKPHQDITTDQISVMQNLARLACNALERSVAVYPHNSVEKDSQKNIVKSSYEPLTTLRHQINLM